MTLSTVAYISFLLAQILISFQSEATPLPGKKPPYTVVRSGDSSADQRSLQYDNWKYDGSIYALDVPRNISFEIQYEDNWKVHDIQAVTYWDSGIIGGVDFTAGGVGYNFWEITWYLPANASASTTISVNTIHEVPEKFTLPTLARYASENHYKFDDMDIVRHSSGFVKEHIKYKLFV